MKRLLCVGVCVVSCLTLTACESPKPEGFPENLIPVKITVTNTEGPVEGARVVLTDKSGSIIIGATTDADGVAKVRTVLANYSEEGVEPGEYKVTVQKEPRVADTWTQQDYVQKGKTEADKHGAEIRAAEAKMPRIVPEALTRIGSTPLSITVASDPVDFPIDLTKF